MQLYVFSRFENSITQARSNIFSIRIKFLVSATLHYKKQQKKVKIDLGKQNHLSRYESGSTMLSIILINSSVFEFFNFSFYFIYYYLGRGFFASLKKREQKAKFKEMKLLSGDRTLWENVTYLLRGGPVLCKRNDSLNFL